LIRLSDSLSLENIEFPPSLNIGKKDLRNTFVPEDTASLSGLR